MNNNKTFGHYFIQLIKYMVFAYALIWLASCKNNDRILTQIFNYNDSIHVNHIKQYQSKDIGTLIILQCEEHRYNRIVDSLKIELER